MCLAVPGKIIEITDNDPINRTGKVSFGGIIKDINLAFVPEAEIDSYVIVHAGFAISMLDEKEADEIFGYLKQIGEIEGMSER
jgi:hydrogenase expression/formation protein HypC